MINTYFQRGFTMKNRIKISITIDDTIIRAIDKIAESNESTRSETINQKLHKDAEIKALVQQDKKTFAVYEIGQICHAVLNAYCISIGDDSYKKWVDLDSQTKEIVINGVQNVIDNPDITPQQHFENWKQQRIVEGWKYGKRKDYVNKLHPNLVLWDELNEAQRMKDSIFINTVKSLI